MNNQLHAAGGPGAHHINAPALPLHHGRREQYHGYHNPPQSPVAPNYYGNYHPQYYGHTPQYRWQQPQYAPQHFVPHQHMQQAQYAPRSPMVVSSQPHAQPMTPVTRQPSAMVPPPTQTTQSPRPIPPYLQQPPQTLAAPPSPLAAPIPAPVPKTEDQPAEIASPAQPESTRQASAVLHPLSLPAEYKDPYWPPLPLYFPPGSQSAFLARATPRRRRRRNLRAPNDSVALPAREQKPQEYGQEAADSQAASAEELPSEASTIAAPSEPETPATSQAPSESEFTQASTPATPAQASENFPKPTPTQQHVRRDTRTAIAVPNLPSLSKAKEASPSATVKPDAPAQGSEAERPENEEVQHEKETTEYTISTPPKPTQPKSWADLVRVPNKPGAPSTDATGQAATNGFQLPKSASLADALAQYNVNSDAKLPFLEPRGLVNTGNMCYMNSILQILVFCVPFYNFLDQVRQRTVHSMQSQTPLVDAMIMFMREFKVLASADTVQALRSTLKQEQLEMYGEPITPEYVYEVIKKLPRFAGMRRGHQQDAEEFLGFLLEGLHDECALVMKGQSAESASGVNGIMSPGTVMSPGSADGWMEVGAKQKQAITRTAGQQEEPSPVTKIFGGHLRSELSVSGAKMSVTLEPYKPLQLDIGAPDVNNILDALKGITRAEHLTGEFGGKGTAKKQVFIDTLPPVLILHLKRFQYDNSFSGTQKIWKKVGYPLELEIPKEVFSPSKRSGLAVRGGPPKYRLTSVVYHHGKSAAGGHYTVDVLREDSREWVRIDDTVIRRIRPEDVAEGGSEEDPKILAKALEQHKADQELQKQRNMYEGLDEADKESEEEKPWSEVNGHPSGHAKKWTGVAPGPNGSATPTSTTGKRTPTARKEGVRDNKVAYILLYERIRD